MLTVHVDEVIQNIFEPFTDYEKKETKINAGIENWNKNKGKITDRIAWQAYEAKLLEEHFFEMMSQNLLELKLISTYYHSVPETNCIRLSTTIGEALAKVETEVAAVEACIVDGKKSVAHDIFTLNHYFMSRGIQTSDSTKKFKEKIKKESKEQREKKSQKLREDQKKFKENENAQKSRIVEKYANMYEVFEKTIVGKILKDAVEGTKFAYKNASKIFRAIKDIPEFGIKKGDFLYLDKMHGDHIEVFKECRKMVRTILNMDGTQNAVKLADAINRKIKEWIC